MGGSLGNRSLRLFYRGRSCLRLEECYNFPMPVDRGNQERYPTIIVRLVEMGIILCKQ
ncbi:hypothetical protein B9Z19DRAFT_1094498 [Tuber borchii]|uniref:Uncharacterized protein n=1 Tax=Tuber borchii TaxID=42251 RepID=A0A2T6ZDY2_TUBBO|nr:hypothetical protein B9Z19DRAFT_1094498 [Tuber borchii]